MTSPVVVNVVNQSYTTELEFFGVPLIVGTVSSDVATLMTERAFTVTPNNYKTALAAKGFVSSDAHWKHCAAIFAQADAASPVTSVVIGRRATPVAKVITITVGGNTDGDYSIQVNADTPQVYAASGKTQTQIRDALLALFVGNATVTGASVGANQLTLTANAAGLDFDVTLASPGDVMTQAVSTPNTGIYEDLDAIKAEDFTWFGIIETAHSKAAILDGARWASEYPVKFFAETNDSEVKSNAAGNVAAALKAKAYKNTSLRYHHTGSELYTAALVGRCLGYDVGRIQWSHRKLVGVTARNYGAEAGVVEAFELNYVGRYDTEGRGRSLYNYTCDGGFIDNPRPALYGSGYETFLPRAVTADRTETVRLVGKHCESGDVLVPEAKLPPGVEVGDIVATPVTGAYGRSMGSNYNLLHRPAVVFVSGGEHRLVIRAETDDDLLATDVG